MTALATDGPGHTVVSEQGHTTAVEWRRGSIDTPPAVAPPLVDIGGPGHSRPPRPRERLACVREVVRADVVPGPYHDARVALWNSTAAPVSVANIPDALLAVPIEMKPTRAVDVEHHPWVVAPTAETATGPRPAAALWCRRLANPAVGWGDRTSGPRVPDVKSGMIFLHRAWQSLLKAARAQADVHHIADPMVELAGCATKIGMDVTTPALEYAARQVSVVEDEWALSSCDPARDVCPRRCPSRSAFSITTYSLLSRGNNTFSRHDHECSN